MDLNPPRLRQPVDQMISSLRDSGYAFRASSRGDRACFETTGWMEAGQSWHLFREGRSACRQHAITSVLQHVRPAAPRGVRECRDCHTALKNEAKARLRGAKEAA